MTGLLLGSKTVRFGVFVACRISVFWAICCCRELQIVWGDIVECRGEHYICVYVGMS